MEGAPFQAEVGREDHPGDPLPLAAVAGGHQVLEAEGKADELMNEEFTLDQRLGAEDADLRNPGPP